MTRRTATGLLLASVWIVGAVWACGSSGPSVAGPNGTIDASAGSGGTEAGQAGAGGRSDAGTNDVNATDAGDGAAGAGNPLTRSVGVQPGKYPVTLGSGTTYYVSSSDPNADDSNPGTDRGRPWKTLDKVNSTTFQPGDNVLFKSGDRWTLQKTLIISSAGTSTNGITLSSYGTGGKPIITMRGPVPSWNDSSQWTQVGTSNEWYIHMPSYHTSNPIQRLWLDGQEAYMGLCGQDADGVQRGNPDGSCGITANWRFYQPHGTDELHVYSVGNPASYYQSMEYAGGYSLPGASSSSVYPAFVVAITGAYVTLNGLDIEGGAYASLELLGADHAVVQNCDIGKYSNWAGIVSLPEWDLSSAKSSSYVIVRNDVVDSDWKYPYSYYTARTPYGITPGGGSQYWEVYNNTVHDWWMDIYPGSSFDGGPTAHDSFHNNDISSPDFTFSKCIQVNGVVSGSTDYSATHVDFYDNYCHDLQAGGIQNSGGKYNNFYFNIFTDITVSTNGHADQSNSGFGIEFLSGGACDTCDSSDAAHNNVFNNSFVNLNQLSVAWSGSSSLFENNLFVNNNMAYKNAISIQESPTAPNTWQNNLFFKTGYGTDAKFVEYTDNTSYTVNQFNGLTGTYAQTIGGNVQYTGSLAQLIDVTDFVPPSGSPTAGAGLDISSLVPSGFTDPSGKVVNRTQPSIGAMQ